MMLFFTATLALGTLAVWLAVRTLKTNRTLLDRVQQMAREDALTGAINRRGLNEALPVEFARAQRSGEPLTLVDVLGTILVLAGVGWFTLADQYARRKATKLPPE